jgi:FkbM family methyltransferase
MALKRRAAVTFNDSDEGIIAVTPKFKAHVSAGEELFILREILCDDAYNFGTAAQNVVVWDIGMNAGLASLYFASRSNVRAVVAFEPFRPTFDAAVRNIELNPELAPKIKMHNFGLAARSYETEVEYNSRWKGGLNVRELSPDRRKELETLDETLTVEHIKLQPADDVLRSILADYPDHSVVAKIDCEGSEYEIVRCLHEHRLLQEISIIMMEWHDRGPGELLAMLHDSGFSTYSFPLGSLTGMLYAFQQGGHASEGRMRTSLSSSDKGESEL